MTEMVTVEFEVLIEEVQPGDLVYLNGSWSRISSIRLDHPDPDDVTETGWFFPYACGVVGASDAIALYDNAGFSRRACLSRGILRCVGSRGKLVLIRRAEENETPL